MRRIREKSLKFTSLIRTSVTWHFILKRLSAWLIKDPRFCRPQQQSHEATFLRTFPLSSYICKTVLIIYTCRNNRISFTKHRERLSPSPLALPYMLLITFNNFSLFHQRETVINPCIKARIIQEEPFWKGWLERSSKTERWWHKSCSWYTSISHGQISCTVRDLELAASQLTGK